MYVCGLGGNGWVSKMFSFFSSVSFEDVLGNIKSRCLFLFTNFVVCVQRGMHTYIHAAIQRGMHTYIWSVPPASSS